MKEFTHFLLPLAEYQLTQASYQYTFRCRQFTLNAQVDNQLKIYVGSLSQSNTFRFRQDCFIYPRYQDKVIVQLVLYSCQKSLHITGIFIQILYNKLSIVFRHKGFTQFFKSVKRLGRGSFATVYLVEHKQTGCKFAAKVFSKQRQKISSKGKQAFQNQVMILKEVQHPNLIKFKGVYETESLVYLLTEYLSGGTLEHTLKSKPFRTGEFIKEVLSQILSALAYLNEKKIMHRDIKPENIFLRQLDQKWVIGDFGLAAKQNEEYIYDKCGTMGYVAPQIMQFSSLKYTQSCDIYSLGIIAYQLIFGQLPFVFEKVGPFEKKLTLTIFSIEQCKYMREEIITLLKNMLQSNPCKRIKPNEALQSQFFKDEDLATQLTNFQIRKRKNRYDRILKTEY